MKQTVSTSTTNAVQVRMEEIVMPTFLPASPDKNPMFLEKRVYQGSSGRIYPLPFSDRIARMQANAVHAFHAAHRIVIAAPNGLRAVGVFLDFKIHRQERRRPMMLRPIEFDTSRNPRPGEPDERRLDDGLMINQVVAVGLVLQPMDATAEFRQDHHAERFVFNPYCLPRAPHWFFGDAI